MVNGNSTTLGQAVLTSGGGGCGTGTTPATYVAAGCYSYYRQTLSPTPFGLNNLGGTAFDLRTIDYGFFAQDDWKVMPRLTVNLGARYDYESIPNEQSQLVQANNPGSTNTPSDKNNISPRVGFSLDPYGLGKTVLRGGFGLYYGRIPNVNLLGARFNSGSPNGQLGYNFSSPHHCRCAAVLAASGGCHDPCFRPFARHYQHRRELPEPLHRRVRPFRAAGPGAQHRAVDRLPRFAGT